MQVHPFAAEPRVKRIGILDLCLTVMVAASSACGDSMLEGEYPLISITSGNTPTPNSPNAPINARAASPNCRLLATVSVPTGFAGQEGAPSIDVRWDNSAVPKPWVAWAAIRGTTGSSVHVNTWDTNAWRRVGDVSEAAGILDTGAQGAKGVWLRFATDNSAYLAWPTLDANLLATLHVMQSSGGAWIAGIADPNFPIQPASNAPDIERFAFDLVPYSNSAAMLWQGSPSDQPGNALSVVTNSNILAKPAWAQVAIAPSSVDVATLMAGYGTTVDLYWAQQVPQAAVSYNGNWLTDGPPHTTDGNYPINYPGGAGAGFQTSSTPDSLVAAVRVTGVSLTGLAWEDTRAGTRNIYYRQLGVSTWTQLGQSDTGPGVSGLTSQGGARHVSLAIDNNNYPIIAYEDVSAHQVVVQAWNGETWTAPWTTSRASYSAWWPRLALRDDGTLLLAWEEDNALIQVCQLR